MTQPQVTFPDVVSPLQSAIQTTLGSNLVGLYLYGSLVYGDFNPDISDIDLLAAVQNPLSDQDLDALRMMHAAIVGQFPTWNDRIEVAYLPLQALGSFKHERSPIGIISPGEPLHRIEAGIDWQINWYFVLSHGMTLAGPEPATFITPVNEEEFLDSSLMMLREWRGRIPDLGNARGISYCVLTLARSLYTLTNQEHVSKDKAAAWTGKHFPEWKPLLDQALRIRVEPGHDLPDPNAVASAQAFFEFVSSKVDPAVQK